MNAKQDLALAISVAADAIASMGVEGMLVADVLRAIDATFLSAPAPTPIEKIAGVIISRVVGALGGADQAKAMLEAQYEAAAMASDAAARKVLSGG